MELREALTQIAEIRQQMAREAGRPNLALSDFIAPVGVEDYIGGFVVTAGLGEDKHIKKFEAAKDDYSAILLRALADRLRGRVESAQDPELLAEVDALRQEVAELHERVDFAERILLKTPERKEVGKGETAG